jgi:eukaryotic-like serine/threonine-protein kinase
VQDDPTRTVTLDAADARIGRTISGKFRVLAEIGRGGMGVVYEAEDVSLKRTVALKFLPPELTQSPEARRRFIQEAQSASALEHVNICAIHEIGETEAGEMFIAMPRYRGESLREKIERTPIPAGDVLDLAVQIADGLAKAHERGIVHRDLKPGNVFVTEDGTAKLLDFGLAKLLGRERTTLTGVVQGTPAYMSPEQVRGDAVDARTDVWSLGVVLYEMVTGRRPFQRDKDESVFFAILNEPPKPVPSLRPGFPPGLETVIGRALAKDPARRFASARAMADALRELKEQVAGEPSRTARRLMFRRRSRVAIAVVAVALFLVVVGPILWYLNRPALAFASRDQLMVADVENGTGDKVFDVALRTAIEADLQQSRYAIVFDRPQIAETLRLMRKEPGTRVDEAIACDVCRFAGVRAFVLPRILSAGSAYEVEAILVDPVTRRHVDRIRVTARSREDVLLHGIDALGRQVRSRLGESLSSIQKADRPVSQVTTSSWDALNYFSRSQTKREAASFKEAAALLELALENDPQFVDARSSLGLLYCQVLGDAAKGREMLRRALRDAEGQGLPQRQLLKLRAVNKEFVDGNRAGALEQYRIIVELFPEDMPSWNNSGMILKRLGRPAEAVAMFEKAASVARRNSIPLQNLWNTLLNDLKDPAAAADVAARFAALAPQLANSHAALGYTLAVHGRYAEAEKELRRTLELQPRHPYALPNLAHVIFASGRPADAVPVYREMVEMSKLRQTTGLPSHDLYDLALALRDSGNVDQARAVANEARDMVLKVAKGNLGTEDLVTLGLLAAAASEPAVASRHLDQALRRGTKDAFALMDLAELLALQGQSRAAVETVKKSLAAGYSDYFFPVIIPGLQSLVKDPEFRSLFKLPQ